MPAVSCPERGHFSVVSLICRPARQSFLKDLYCSFVRSSLIGGLVCDSSRVILFKIQGTALVASYTLFPGTLACPVRLSLRSTPWGRVPSPDPLGEGGDLRSHSSLGPCDTILALLRSDHRGSVRRLLLRFIRRGGSLPLDPPRLR